jgi:hypothetical protein
MVMLVLVLTLCVVSLGGGLVSVSHTERQIAHTYLRATQVAYAADAAAHLTVNAVSRNSDSPFWPAAGAVPALGGGSRVMTLVAGETVDLDLRTTELNREAAGQWPLGADTPRWRLAGWGRLPDWPSTVRVAVWVADDVMETDGSSSEDSNGLLMIRVESYGPTGAGRAVVAHIRRDPDNVRVVSWREG